MRTTLKTASVTAEKLELPNKLLSQARKLIDSVSWTHARPPRTEEYIVRMRSKEERKVFDFFSRQMKDFSYSGHFSGRKYRYIDVDDHKYWVIWPILNRELLSLQSKNMGHKVAGKNDRVRTRTAMNSNKKPGAYRELRDIIEGRGGTMQHVKRGYRRGGAWEICLDGKRAVIESVGAKSFRPLDVLYEALPDCPNPRTWEDFSGPLVRDAETKLLSLLR